jgi:hypothetical protein
MGGSGGSFGSGYNPRDIAKQVRDDEKRNLNDTEFNIRLGDLFGELLGDFNNRDTEGVRRRLDDILDKLGDETDAKLDLIFGGSVAKRTYVDGLSDIDCLVVLNGTDLEKAGPHAARDQLAKTLAAELAGEATVSAGQLAVTITYTDGMEIQLLPAVRTEVGVKIPSARTEGRWSEIDPGKFQEGLTKYNKLCGNKLIPTIKLAKAVIAQLPEASKLSGYHVESLAIDAFRNYTGTMTTAAMLPHFFEHAKERVLRPMTDRTGQSLHVDGYLGNADSPERQIASHILSRLAKRMSNATAASSLPQWKDLFGADE